MLVLFCWMVSKKLKLFQSVFQSISNIYIYYYYYYYLSFLSHQGEIIAFILHASGVPVKIFQLVSFCCHSSLSFPALVQCSKKLLSFNLAVGGISLKWAVISNLSREISDNRQKAETCVALEFTYRLTTLPFFCPSLCVQDPLSCPGRVCFFPSHWDNSTRGWWGPGWHRVSQTSLHKYRDRSMSLTMQHFSQPATAVIWLFNIVLFWSEVQSAHLCCKGS